MSRISVQRGGRFQDGGDRDFCVQRGNHDLTVANQSLYDIISGLSLTTNLKLCLDAGDSASYDPGVQTDKWLDTSGNGYDFYRGTSTGGDAAEPAFNGSAGGLSGAEYFSFDGGDYFLYDAANEAWMNTLHKDNAVFSIVAVIDFASSGTGQVIFSTRGAAASQGVTFLQNATTDILAYNVADNAGTSVMSVNTGVANPSGWGVVCMSLDEAAGTGRFVVNGTEYTFTSTYTSPSASDVGGTVRIGSRTNGALLVANTGKTAAFAAWQGTELSGTNFQDIFDDIRGRFGL